MPMNITAEMTCENCKKTISVKGKPFRSRHRHGSSGYDFDSLYVVLGIVNDDDTDVTVTRGYTHYVGDDAEGVCCSLECAVAEVGRQLKRIKPRKRDRDQD